MSFLCSSYVFLAYLLIFVSFCLFQLDSNSFFHDLAPGVENDGTGIIVALAAAKALGAAKRNVRHGSSC